MDNYVYLIIGGVLLLGIILMLIFKKNFLTFSGPAKMILEAVKAIVNAYGKADPRVISIIQAAIDGTVKAEELWKQGSLEKEKRNEYAKKYIHEVLDQAKVDYAGYSNIIDCVITLVCYLLPHSEEKA